MSDDLAKLPPAQLAGFYRRLATAVDGRKGVLRVSLASLLMNHWLDNRDRNSTFVFDAPEHLRNHSQVTDVLAYHRKVFLTEEKARVGPKTSKWAGVLPRLLGNAPYAKWDGKLPLPLEYQSLVEIPLRYQVTGSDADKDLLYALHGFQLKSKVVLSFDHSAPAPAKQVRLAFDEFSAQVIDRYDWDYTEHLTVPNPDYQSKEADAVKPGSDRVVVFHSNARRLEEAGLAAPYNLQTNAWRMTDQRLIDRAQVDLSRKL